MTRNTTKKAHSSTESIILLKEHEKEDFNQQEEEVELRKQQESASTRTEEAHHSRDARQPEFYLGRFAEQLSEEVVKILLDNGFEQEEDLLRVPSEDLFRIGIKVGYVNKIRRLCKEMELESESTTSTNSIFSTHKLMKLPKHLPKYNPDKNKTSVKAFLQEFESILKISEYPLQKYGSALALAIEGSGRTWALRELPNIK